MPYLNRGASRLYYELHGVEAPVVATQAVKPAKPVWVLLHGVGGNHASWFHQIAAWRTQVGLLVVDARGFGNSTDAEAAGRGAFVDDLHALLNALQLDRVVLIAQSMGGGTAIHFAIRHPARVSALVLADTMVGLQLPPDMAARMAPVVARANALTQLERVLGPTFQARAPAQSYLYTALASFNETNVRSLTGEQAQATPAELGALGLPILFVAGNEDVLFPPQEIAALAAATTGAEFLEIQDAGHSAYFEQPDVFNHAVKAWLDRVT
ncbi:alpha/beta fold hydrolase [Robbsia andropogonis]|uniref:alpha/beta fold hydrolase n=1 Tax=Robbsia andropogonis TaxID=28092 RepID=UPI0004655D5A|nr:alpha/beta fold hydrolase [Robbsia andropogonis]MCP1120800.1 alpha/beta hydrolase [Robbsia andropogonis]MCP1130593.1 alpha/beta hydrolase [Robbsia andropogonis]